MELSLRLYNKKDRADYKQLVPLMKSFLEDYYGKKDISEVRVNSAIVSFLTTRKEENEGYFLENEDHEVIGFCIISREYRTNSFIIHHFYICPPFRRDKSHHWGTTAFSSLKSLLNPDYIILNVIDGNETAREFWKSLGFVEEIESYSVIQGFPLVYRFTLDIAGKPK